MTHLHTPSARVSGLFSELYIGLMSGTSLDGVDGVLMHHEDGQWRTLAHAHRPFPPALRQALLDLNTPGEDELHRSALAAQALAVVYATVVEAVCQQAQVPPAEVQAIGAHGQTVRHRPDQGYTLQLNQPALLAELTGIDVIADFRSRDVAAGGQGAPLVPAFHQAIFGRPDETVAVLNIGGMANVSILRPGQIPQGFDTGPGNALLDMWCDLQTGHAFDANGEWGASGEVREDWLADALAEPFFHQAPPKSTGRDLFNAEWLTRWLAPHGLTDGPQADAALARDVQATLCELTARSAALALREHAADASDVVVCGGGALNGDLMRRLGEQLPGVRVGRSDAHGLDVMQVEAAAFAWLAWTHLQRLAGNVPAVTGARGPRVLGALYPAR
ncbi:anhydro-N-acetylmuramic acid kinase [Aquabacterium sp.]|jgi:anhydro-N-acetylmuramic acid kinase|uniref:anhydro-N-acetylmuramic acid kinase n=1 Tax=Aquabacterium sp. TaxID=1872578 RepID=UPI001B4C4DED|nr:anhydro-N-acetylmuramic acid kinase [Aquabacterium sp.]MBP6613947.1 anhydro-N-acetylmuramic acid kinase [Aquabacterium sp.]MBP6615894.1 anhydro-N-acetylmuramic acid kinase [Aquabacterium sp.]MBP7503149.1 anhydro-N-acetylmuramic acid kinase [Aquabacterium sp.]MDD2977095.1 anhydro-N-acetylmuramic acid kinase [Aquabacterium sp.]